MLLVQKINLPRMEPSQTQTTTEGVKVNIAHVSIGVADAIATANELSTIFGWNILDSSDRNAGRMLLRNENFILELNKSATPDKTSTHVGFHFEKRQNIVDLMRSHQDQIKEPPPLKVKAKVPESGKITFHLRSGLRVECTWGNFEDAHML